MVVRGWLFEMAVGARGRALGFEPAGWRLRLSKQRLGIGPRLPPNSTHLLVPTTRMHRRLERHAIRHRNCNRPPALLRFGMTSQNRPHIHFPALE